MDLNSIVKDLKTQKAKGTINVKLNGVLQTTNQVTLYSFGDGKGGVIAGAGQTSGGSSYLISIGYPAKDKIKPIVHYKEDYSEPYTPWAYSFDFGVRYEAEKGTLELVKENLPNSVKGKYSFVNKGGTEVSGDFDLTAV
jgi:hypothetical protein